jgi:hypothetical protein
MMPHMDSMDLPEQRMPQTADEIASAIFSECLVTQVRSAAMLMGKVKTPTTGEPVEDLPRVQLIIQQLELLDKNAAKLGLEEQQLIKQSLQELRMAYVSAAGKTPEEELTDQSSDDEEASPSLEPPPGDLEVPTKSKNDSSDDEEETGRKRFVKKYS